MRPTQIEIDLYNINSHKTLGSVQVLHQHIGGGGGLTENADAADASRGVGVSGQN